MTTTQSTFAVYLVDEIGRRVGETEFTKKRDAVSHYRELVELLEGDPKTEVCLYEEPFGIMLASSYAAND